MLAIREIYFLQNQNFNKSAKFIAHKIFVLYGIHYQSLLVTICHNSHMLSHTYYSPIFSCSHTYCTYYSKNYSGIIYPSLKQGNLFLTLMIIAFVYTSIQNIRPCILPISMPTHLFHKVVQFVAVNNYYQNH